MEEQWQASLAGFDAVWQRVQGGAPGTPPPGDSLRRMAETEACYRAAAGRAAGKTAETLRRLAGECRGELRRLRAAGFLQQGTVPPLPTAEPPRGDLAGLLRRACLCEQALTGLDAAMARRSRQRQATAFDLLCRVLP